MKKIFAGILAGLTLLLSGCGAEKNELTSDFQPDFTANFYHYGSMIATEEGYFAKMGTQVYYIDAETMKSTIFCADPTCDHHKIDEDGSSNRDCLATYVGLAMGAIQYYNGEIYFKDVDQSNPDLGNNLIVTLQSVKTDATDLRDIQQLYNQKADRWPEVYGGSNFEYSFAILGDYIMFCPRSSVVKVGKLGEGVEEAKELFTYDTAGPRINGSEAHWTIWVDGGYFYYCGLNYPDGVITGRAAELLYRYDPVTEENTLVWRCDEHSDAYWTDGWYLRDGIFYYYISERQYEDVEAGLYRCDLETLETVKLSDCASFGCNSAAEFDSGYAYIMEYVSNTITVLSLETGEVTAVLDLNAAVEADGMTILPDYGTSFKSFGILGADEKWLFAQCETNECYALYAIEKDRFADNAWMMIAANYYG